MIEFEWQVSEKYNGEWLYAAGGVAASEEDAAKEMRHYASEYAQDGPVKAEMFKIERTLIAEVFS